MKSEELILPTKQQFPEDKKRGPADLKLIKTNQEELIEQEYQEAEADFRPLISLVEARYRSDSAISESKEMLHSFIEHNRDILKLCVRRGIEKGLTEKELKMLEVAAILHDITKADKQEEEFSNIDQYELVAHGEKGAKEAEKILLQSKKGPDILRKITGVGATIAEIQTVVLTITDAIRSHMGPNPGFMAGMLAKVNGQLTAARKPNIEHPYPLAGNKIAEILLAADMHSLAGRQGREKVLAVRANVPFFRGQDKALVDEYRTAGIELSVGEAALQSGFASAEQARDMLRDASDSQWLDKTIDESKEGVYKYGKKEDGSYEEVTYALAINKKRLFDNAKSLDKLREKFN